MSELLYNQLLLASQIEIAVLIGQYLLANLAFFMLATLVDRGKVLLMAFGMTCGILGLSHLSPLIETFAAPDLAVVRKARRFDLKVELAGPTEKHKVPEEGRFFACPLPN